MTETFGNILLSAVMVACLLGGIVGLSYAMTSYSMSKKERILTYVVSIVAAGFAFALMPYVK